MAHAKALITGVSGQDGSYLAEQLLAEDVEVHGTVKPQDESIPSEPNPAIESVLRRLTVHPVAIEDAAAMRSLIRSVRPNECYHLAAQTAVSHDVSKDVPTVLVNTVGTLNVLVALQQEVPACRLCFAASSEIFGNAEQAPQNEQTTPHPRSVYGISKLAALELVRYYRSRHGLFAASAILYNHESPRRDPFFVTRKITRSVARIHAGLQQELSLGSLGACRDWGHATEYVRSMRLMVRAQEPDDFVIATGMLHSVQDFVEHAFRFAGMDWKAYVRTDPALIRKEGGVPLVGDATKAKTVLGWTAETSFETLVEEMVEADLHVAAASQHR